MKVIKAQINDEKVDEEGAGQIATDWMAIADIDESGTVDLDEWTKFI